MKLKSLLTILLLIFSVTGCKTVPPKPQIELCVVDAQNQKCYCSITNANNFIKSSEDLTPENTYNMITNGRFAEEKPLDYCHKAIAFRPFGWRILQDYIHDLELYIQNRCK